MSIIIVSMDMRLDLVRNEQDYDEPVPQTMVSYIYVIQTETEAATIRLQISKPMDMDGDATAVGLACSDPVISRLLAFCDQEDVKRSYTQFCRKHVDVFHGFQVDEDDEKTHTIHDLFLQYERLIETMMQDFLDDEQMTSDVFYTHCRRLVEREREREHGGEHDDTGDSENALLNLRVVLSALDFGAFCSLMAREAVETQRALKQAEDMGL